MHKENSWLMQQRQRQHIAAICLKKSSANCLALKCSKRTEIKTKKKQKKTKRQSSTYSVVATNS